MLPGCRCRLSRVLPGLDVDEVGCYLDVDVDEVRCYLDVDVD